MVLPLDGEGNGIPLQYTCLENPMDGGAWQAAIHGVTKSRTQLSNFTFTFMHWRRKWQPTPVFLPGESQGQGSLVCCHLWGHTESDTTEVTQHSIAQHSIALPLEREHDDNSMHSMMTFMKTKRICIITMETQENG